MSLWSAALVDTVKYGLTVTVAGLVARFTELERARFKSMARRDALDVAMVTTYGGPRLREMVVRADKAEDGAQTAAPPVATVDGPAHRAYDKQTR